ncbi:MAG: GGDEF domain-containing protein, partial [Rhodanobacter sp.]
CLLFLELGINLNGSSPLPGQPWVIPGLLLPVVSSVIWLGRKDFIAAMALCAAGPLPLLMLGAIDGRHIYQYVVYMAIAIALSCVLRSFMARTLFAQYRLEQRLREQAYTDGLTGLLQRNRFLELAQHALDDCRQRQRPASVLYLDTDHFKQRNDEYGHATGDAALIGLASVLRTHARGTDLIGRIGGEEFAVLLPGLDLTRTCVRAELLREAVRQIQRPDGPLTISTGVTESRYPGETIETMLARADQAMRQAKRDGRDRIVSDGQAIAS